MAYAFTETRLITGWDPNHLSRHLTTMESFRSVLEDRKHPFTCLLVDQLEEIYTRVDDLNRKRFFEILRIGVETGTFGIVCTLRNDFLSRTSSDPDFVLLQQHGTPFPLGIPGHSALQDMLIKPAQKVSLQLEFGLENRLLEDIGTAPGSLALMAFTRGSPDASSPRPSCCRRRCPGYEP